MQIIRGTEILSFTGRKAIWR